MTARCCLLTLALIILRAHPAAAQPAAANPAAIEIGTTPQLFVDNFIVDNTWAMRQKVQHIDRAFHPPVKPAQNPT